VNSTPSLHSVNHFTPLFLNENLESNSSYSLEPKNDSSPIHLDPNTPLPHPRCILKWERWLPKCYILAATPSERSFNLDVVIKTTNTGEVHTVSALLNLGLTVSSLTLSSCDTIAGKGYSHVQCGWNSQ